MLLNGVKNLYGFEFGSRSNRVFAVTPNVGTIFRIIYIMLNILKSCYTHLQIIKSNIPMITVHYHQIIKVITGIMFDNIEIHDTKKVTSF